MDCSTPDFPVFSSVFFFFFWPGQNLGQDYMLHLVAMFANTCTDLVLNSFQIAVICLVSQI